MEMPTEREFKALLGALGQAIGDRSLGPELETWLNRYYAPQTSLFRDLAGLVAQGEREGWLCQREAGGIRFGRVIKPGQEAGRFSVDVVRMGPVVGPHHVHPQGEIGMIMRIDGTPQFDGRDEGWYVYGVGSAHHPTVTNGSAHVLYLLPDGAIEFTNR
jgi:hypothetical protein